MKVNATVEEIVAANHGRKAKYVALKYQRMRHDVFAFFRGTDHLFAKAWKEGLRPLDPGPEFLICGDLHLENFGAYCSDQGVFLYDINDFDEATVAPCGFDVVRCMASILLAADVWKLTPVKAERVALAFVGRYRQAAADAAKSLEAKEVQYTNVHGPVHKLLGRAASNTQAHLLSRQTRHDKDGHPRIRQCGGLHPRLRSERASEVRDAVQEYGESKNETCVYRVLDVARRIAGIGSLGVRRYLVLIEGGGAPDKYRILDIKEANSSTIAPYVGKAHSHAGADDVRRVVEAQRHLQARPPAGLGVLKIGEHGYRMREMVPAENRTSLDQFRKSTSKLGRAVVMAGRITGWSHVRGARLEHADRVSELVAWTNTDALDALLASAVRLATRARRDYRAFCAEFDARGPRSLARLSDPQVAPKAE